MSQTYRLGDVAAIFDGPHATPKKTDRGPWYLSISSLNNGRLNIGESAHLSDADFATWARRVTPQPDDVLFSYETRLGEAALMPSGLKACLGRRMGLLRLRTDIVNPRYMLYRYLAPDFQALIKERTIHGATVDRIPLAEMAHWPIQLPDVGMQQQIAELLGALDDKIDLNRRTNETNRQLRHALIDQALRELDPLTPLSDLADFVNGRAFTAQADGHGRSILRIRELNSGIDSGTPRTSKPIADEHLAVADTLLLAWSGSLGLHRWHGPEAVINQHIFKVVPKARAWLVEYWCDKHISSFRNIAADKATTMGHIQKRHLDEALCSVPDVDAINELDGQVGPMYDLEHRLSVESATLAELRDALLPELISGRMTVKEAQAAL